MENENPSIQARLIKNLEFQNSLMHFQFHFVGHRLGTNFHDIGSIGFSNINYQIIEEKMKMSSEFTKRLELICGARNENEILELIPDPLCLVEIKGLQMNLEKQKQENSKLVSELNKTHERIDELSKINQELLKTIEERKNVVMAVENSGNTLKRKADERNDLEDKSSKRRRIE